MTSHSSQAGVQDKLERVNGTLRLLLIEDQPADARLLQEILSGQKSPSFRVEWVQRLSVALERLSQGSIDVILSDLGLPDCHGFETFDRVHAQAPQIPVIVLTGLSDDAAGVEAVRRGAQDYLVKGQLDGSVLARIIRYAYERTHAEHELRRAYAQNEQLLAAISSILIGLDPQGVVTMWNGIAEATLGVPARVTLNQLLERLEIPWDVKKIQQGIAVCRTKDGAVRLKRCAIFGPMGRMALSA